jgi:DNA invertase Pin-like site-specific DNA recombinase
MSIGLESVAWIAVGALGGFVAMFAAAASLRAWRRHTPAAQSADAAPDAGIPPAPLARSAVIGYVTVPADAAGAREGEARRALADRCERRGWKLLEVVRDTDEGPSLQRPGLRYARDRILAGEATGLVMNDLECLSRSMVDLGAVLTWFRDAHAPLIALDLDIDTSTPEGEQVATTLIALSSKHQQRIASGTRRGLAKGRAEGHTRGRPALSQRPDLVERIAAMRAANMTLSAIAEQLNADGVPTLRGGKKWRPSSIQAALGYQRPASRDHRPAARPRARP